jgi:carbonic anhydrase
VQKEILADLAKGQRPYATMLSCSDSRVPPELVFAAGFGELFIVRVVGNVLSSEVVGSLQYAGRHLHTPLFLVLGHTNCGAVAAAIDTRLRGTRQLSRIQILVDSIPRRPRRSRLAVVPGGDAHASRRGQRPLEHAADSRNTRRRERQAEGRMELVGAIYEIETGGFGFWSESGSIRCSCGLPLEAQMTDADGRVFGIR